MAQLGTSAEVLSFPGRSKDWTQQELAEFYRVENALTQSGLRVSSDRGLTDEGDPWFVFFRENDHEPLVHFARIDGLYIIASAAYDGVAKGKNFREMILDLLSRHRLNTDGMTRKSNVFFHPAALLVTLVGVAFFKAPSAAKADDGHDADHAPQKAGVPALANLKAAVTYAQNPEARAPAPAPQFSGLSEEMTSVLVSAIADLSLMGTTAAAKDLAVDGDGGAAALEGTIHPSSSVVKNGLPLQPFVTGDNSSSHAALLIDNAVSGEGAKADMAAMVYDARSLVSLLNSVPVSTEPNDLTALSALTKQAGYQAPALASATTIAEHSDDGAALFYARAAASDATKVIALTTNALEKDQKAASLDQSKALSDSSHTTDGASGSASATAATNPAQLAEIDHKAALASTSSSALAIINLLDQSFHFTEWSNITTSSAALDDPAKAAASQPSAGAAESATSSPTGLHNYSLAVIDNAIQSPASAAAPSTGANSGLTNDINSGANNWSGAAVGNLLEKFLHTFTKVSFSTTSGDEFIFRTEASQISPANLEHITINFQDGSNIDIIGQKEEIDSFMGTA